MPIIGFVLMLSHILFWTSFSAVEAAERIDGFEIKQQAREVKTSNGSNLELLVSDKRSFFPCSETLSFSPRFKNDWSTVKVECRSENWSTVLRSNQSSSFNELTGEGIDGERKIKTVIVKKNIVKGEVITEEHLSYSFNTSEELPGSFTNISEAIGRKAKFNLARGAILKSRQLAMVYPVEKGKAVLVIADNSRVSITVNAIALERGQIGDMIKVKNSSSGRVLNAIVLGEKKVAPLTNM
jgi:flagella basal body P-ring formation protein FlgA